MEKDISPKEITFENLSKCYNFVDRLEFYEKVNKYIEKHGFDETVKQLLDEVLKSDNETAKQLQDAVLKSDNKYFYYFMLKFKENVKGADTQKLQDAIIESGNAEYSAKVRNDIREELRRLDEKEKQIAGEKPTETDDENA